MELSKSVRGLFTGIRMNITFAFCSISSVEKSNPFLPAKEADPRKIKKSIVIIDHNLLDLEHQFNALL
jgi:hypothetical protein